MTTFFKIIKQVLDAAYEELEKSSRDKKIAVALDSLQSRYGKIYEEGGPSYSDPHVRFAYIYRYTTAHAEMVAQRVAASKAITGILSGEDVSITCVGGGPGSDILGFFKFLIELKAKKKPSIKFFLIDGESAWADSWVDIDTLVSKEIKTSKNFIGVNVTEEEEWKKHKKPSKSDIFTFVFFLSELHKSKKKATKYFQHLIAEANPGAIFLFLDFDHSNNTEWADELISGAKLKVLEKADKHDFRLSPTEEKSDLGDYVKKFGPPKLSGRIFFRVCKKP